MITRFLRLHYVALFFFLFGFAAVSGAEIAQTNTYDPLQIETSFTPQNLELTVKDTLRKREIPILIYLPA